MSDLPEYFWDDLLDYIEADKVIPIIGPELVTVPAADGEIPLYRHVRSGLLSRFWLLPVKNSMTHLPLHSPVRRV